MIYVTHKNDLRELASTEGVFTTAQAERFGISPNDLSQYAKSGTVERIIHGAYRLSGSGASELDELKAIWKLTCPGKLSYERMNPSDWDGVSIGGSTAAAIHGIGDFHLSPYRLLAPKRVQSRRRCASFARRVVDIGDVMFVEGLPVTRIERTLVDLILDSEDPSLIETAYYEAQEKGLDEERFDSLLKEQASYPRYEYAVITLGKGPTDEL